MCRNMWKPWTLMATLQQKSSFLMQIRSFDHSDGTSPIDDLPPIKNRWFSIVMELWWDGSLLKMAPIELEGIRCFFRFSLGNPGPIPGHIDNHGADRVEQRRTSSSRPAGASVSAVSAGACTKYGDLDNGWWHWGGQFLDVSSNSLGNQWWFIDGLPHY